MGFFSEESRVLLANGEYKDIKDVMPGDYVYNMHSETAKVLDVTKQEQGIIEIKYSGWYAAINCTGESELLVIEEREDGISEMKWMKAEDLRQDVSFMSETNIYRDILPGKFSIPFRTMKKNLSLECTYEIGLLFGLYAGYGYIEENTINFTFGPNEELVKKLQELLLENLKAESKISKDNYCYNLTVDCNISENKHMLEIFQEFGEKMERKVPKKYWVNDENFIRGLFDGLVEYDPENNSSRLISVSKFLSETMVWICSILGYEMINQSQILPESNITVYPLLINNKNDDSVIGKIIEIKKSMEKSTVYNLTVDCPTKSFIVNGLVVK